MKKYFLFSILVVSSINYSKAQQWKDVGGGADFWVECLFVDSTSNLLYVGGAFNQLGSISAHQIGIWNGSAWGTIGNNDIFSGSSHIEAIAKFNGDLIVAGIFDSVANIQVNNVARWDGVKWNAMGSGFDDGVTSLQIYNGELYAGGQFLSSGNDTLHNIAKWNGIPGYLEAV